jgi:predicted secreted hydrolase
MAHRSSYVVLLWSTVIGILLTSCNATASPRTSANMPALQGINTSIPDGFAFADGSRLLVFPKDLGAHEDFHTEWWYYTGNLQTAQGRHFGFEITIFRVGLIPSTVPLPDDSQWYNRGIYFAHFALSDISDRRFYAFDRYSRPGPGLAGADSEPYHVWIEDWQISEVSPQAYRLKAAQKDIVLDLTLTDEMGIVLHGENGYSRKGQGSSNASYYYSQPRLRTDGVVQVDGDQYTVTGLSWHDHEFSSSVLDENEIGWDWFSLQLDDGAALMLFQLRERAGTISAFSSGSYIASDGTPQNISKNNFEISTMDEWQSPHTDAVYPAAWKIDLPEQNCTLTVQPWMDDQEVNLQTVTYWEGAVRFDGSCNGKPVHGNGYVELTGYAGKVPLR